MSRDRRLWKLIAEKYLRSNIQILDFSPSRSLFRKWKEVTNVKHIASDLSGDFIADVSYDITQIPEKDAQFDLIICYHILEHVVDDGEIYEDYAITSESERLIHFGQEDHVRIYSVDGLKKRLESVGFSIIVKQYEKDEYLGFSNEIMLVATK